MQDITPVDKLKANPKCDRDVAVFGYLRGCNLKPSTHMHVAGAGDYKVHTSHLEACLIFLSLTTWLSPLAPS